MNARFWLVNERSVISEQQTAPLNNRPQSNQSLRAPAAPVSAQCETWILCRFRHDSHANKHTTSFTTKRWSQECFWKHLKREIEDAARTIVSICSATSALPCTVRGFSPVRRWLGKRATAPRWNIFFITMSKGPFINIFVNSPCNKRALGQLWVNNERAEGCYPLRDIIHVIFSVLQ